MNTYNPPRKAPQSSEEPLEVDLVYNVRPCGTCTFFWPQNGSPQPYGPFPTYSFEGKGYPKENKPKNQQVQNYPWVKGVTNKQGFPNGEVMDGCRKAPIMTIGINPNLTAFSPGQEGTSWIYPSFSGNEEIDAYAQYAYYYRYRSVYQEHLSFDFMEQHLMNDGQIKAEKDGELKGAERAFVLDKDNNILAVELSLTIAYEGEEEKSLVLKRNLGEARYVLLFDHFPPNNAFKAGDVIAGLLDVKAGEEVEVMHGAIGYYEQFVPVLTYFEHFLEGKGFMNPQLKIGEDVGQLDMVACASPHWNQQFMGGQLETVVNNCVHKNAWAIKQLVQTKPVVLFLVGESSFDMFNENFGKLIKRDIPLSERPVDGAFTLFKETVSLDTPTFIEFKTEIEGQAFSLKTRLVVAPHFSYDSNYVPQYRMSIKDWEKLKNDYPKSYDFIHKAAEAKHCTIVYAKSAEDYLAVTLSEEPKQFQESLEKADANGAKYLDGFFYNPHLQMADLLGELYDHNLLTYKDPQSSKESGLSRTESSCHFCVNSQWEFPLGCPYDKNKETPPSKGFLAAVAKKMVAEGS